MGTEYYENKTFNTIKQDIKQEFKNIEKKAKWWYRDDQEIYKAWENMIDKYISQLSNAGWMWISNEKRWVNNGKAELIKSENLYKDEALQYFKQAKANFSKRRNEVVKEKSYLWTWIYITSHAENEKQIKEVSESIDAAEEEALKKIRMVCNPKQEWTNAVEHSSVARDKQWNVRVNNWEVVRQKPMYTQSEDWTLTFTDRSNPVKIHDALWDLFKDKDKIYKIDYSKCTNTNIKTKMNNLIGWLSCWIRYSKDLQTYVLTDKQWNIINNRALIWEWVTLKPDTIVEHQQKEVGWLPSQEAKSLEKIRSASKQFEFDINNYRYYEQFRQICKTNICSTYAYWCVSDILAKNWCCFPSQEVDAWKIKDQSAIKDNFNINDIDKTNPQQQIVDAPAWSFLTMRFDHTNANSSWVSHVMVSLWNGVYTDLFWSHIRQIDFKSETNFSWNKFTLKWQWYTLTEDARLMTPNLNSFIKWSEQPMVGSDLTPNEFANKIHETTWANINYIKSLIARKNNITASDFDKKYSNLSVNIVTKEINALEIDNKEWSNDVSTNFLDALKNYKADIMKHYPNLSNHDYDEIAKRAIWILYQESDAWHSKKYILKEMAHLTTLPELLSSRLWSRWFTQIKFDWLFSESDKQFLKTFDINWAKDLTNPEKCGIATIVWLIGNYFNIIVPMKKDSFWTNDATITELTFNDGKKESIAPGKKIRIDWKFRTRTEQEIQEKIKQRGEKHWRLVGKTQVTRQWLSTDDDFFDMLYYTRSKPSEIYYWTATPSKNNYIAQANSFIDDHIDGTYTWTYSA